MLALLADAADAPVPKLAVGPAPVDVDELPNRPSILDPFEVEVVDERSEVPLFVDGVEAAEREAERETTSCSFLARLSEEMAVEERDASSSGFGG